LGTDKDLQENEVLEVDNHAYEMLHSSSVELPCLTCDFIIKDY